MNRYRSLHGLLLLIAACLRLAAHSAVESAPRTDASWKERHELLNRRANDAGPKAKIVFIGDSITQGWEGAGREVWEQRFSRYNAVNLGIGGDRTQHVLWRLENGNLNTLKPAAVVLMIGTNNSNGDDNSVEQIAEGVSAILSKIRAALPETTVLLHPIFPRGENPNAQRGKINQVNQILQKRAEDRRIVWVDFGHRFMDDRGVISRDWMPDFLHLSPAGYKLWADALEPHLARILGDQTTTRTALSGDWILTIPGPNNEPVEVPMNLREENGRITGWIARGSDKRFDITDGKSVNDTVSWVIRRDRPSGGSMNYRMSGRFTGDRLSGKTETEMDGNPVSNEWSARRK